MAMIPTVGVVYEFSFSAGYTVHDGIYHVGQILTYEDMVSTITTTLYSNFYSPANKTESDMNNDLSMIKDTLIMKLLDPDTLKQSGALYAPLCYLALEPDPNVKKYYSLGIGTYLGVYDDKDQLSYLVNNLNEELVGTLGELAKDVEIFTINGTWMKTGEYEAIINTRLAKKTSILNYFLEAKRLRAQLDKAISKNEAYEEIITKQLNSGG